MTWTVAAAFADLLADLALTPNRKATADARFSHLETYFARSISTAGGLWRIGSYDHSTLIRWRRDLDVLVALAIDPYWTRCEHDSGSMPSWIRNRINDEYGNSQVCSKQVAVRMLLGEGFQVDLVPGFYRKGGGSLMPDGKGGWRATNPPYHAEVLSEANAVHGSRLKPLVRVKKAWNVANAQHLQSFHLEMMVWEMWPVEKGLPAMPQAIAEMPGKGATWMAYPVNDPAHEAGTRRLDGHLSDDERGILARMFTTDAAAATQALAYASAGQTEKAFERWAVVFRNKLPAYG